MHFRANKNSKIISLKASRLEFELYEAGARCAGCIIRLAELLGLAHHTQIVSSEVDDDDDDDDVVPVDVR